MRRSLCFVDRSVSAGHGWSSTAFPQQRISHGFHHAHPVRPGRQPGDRGRAPRSSCPRSSSTSKRSSSTASRPTGTYAAVASSASTSCSTPLSRTPRTMPTPPPSESWRWVCPSTRDSPPSPRRTPCPPLSDGFQNWPTTVAQVVAQIDAALVDRPRCRYRARRRGPLQPGRRHRDRARSDQGPLAAAGTHRRLSSTDSADLLGNEVSLTYSERP